MTTQSSSLRNASSAPRASTQHFNASLLTMDAQARITTHNHQNRRKAFKRKVEKKRTSLAAPRHVFGIPPVWIFMDVEHSDPSHLNPSSSSPSVPVQLEAPSPAPHRPSSARPMPSQEDSGTRFPAVQGCGCPWGGRGLWQPPSPAHPAPPPGVPSMLPII